MTNIFKNILITAAALTVSSAAFAQRAHSTNTGYTTPSTYSSSVSYGHQNEIIATYGHGFLTSGQGYKNGPTVTNIEIAGKYLRTLTANIQVGGMAGISSFSGSGSRTGLTAVGVGVWNFDVDFKEAFFAEAGAGIYPVLNSTQSDFESKIGLYVGGGKRFPIWERVNFIPSAYLVKKGDLDVGIDIEFLNLSIMF
jgi:hypothetical protein